MNPSQPPTSDSQPTAGASEPRVDDAALADSLRLSLVTGVGPRLRKALLEELGTASAVLAAAPADLRRVQGIGPELTRRLAMARQEIDVQAELDLCAAHGIAIMSDMDPAYPRMLSEIYDPPGILFMRGELLACDAVAIAIVGSRHATHYGLEQAERLAGSLARAGVTIVSGLARGIDAAAHCGALAAGGRTLAVLGSGFLNMYPPEHAGLGDEVAAHGALISEAPPALERGLSAVQSHHQRPVAGRARGRSFHAIRRADHRATRHGAGPRGSRRAWPDRQSHGARLSPAAARRSQTGRDGRRRA
jgi:DNA processing protein